MQSLDHTGGPYENMSQISQSPPPLKRRRATSAPCDNESTRQRKRSKASSLTEQSIPEECDDDMSIVVDRVDNKGKGKAQSGYVHFGHGGSAAIIDELALELKCGCCTELCYHPVIVTPCQHFFCGSCCILWIRNGGTNCPACRGISTSVLPSRVLQSMIDLLLRWDPSKARTENERAQADEVYKPGTIVRLPTPRLSSPEPNLEPTNDNFARPCPTCPAGNPYGWRCPIPIQDPTTDIENAFDLDDGTPTGHAFCGNCDQLHNLEAPTTTRCDFCQVSFCGVGIQARCCALSLHSQQPHGLNELPDIILNAAIYDKFQGNSVEVDILVDYLRIHDVTLRSVYKEIVAHTLQQSRGFMPLIETGIFDDLHGVSGGDDPDPAAPRRRICRLCASQVLIHGLKDWWIRERKHGNLTEDVASRKDCVDGSRCERQNDAVHCKEFNHIIFTHTEGDDTRVDVIPVATPSAAMLLPPGEAQMPFDLFVHPAEIDVEMLFTSPHDSVYQGGPLLNPSQAQTQNEIVALSEAEEQLTGRIDNTFGMNGSGIGSLSPLPNSDAKVTIDEGADLQRENSHFFREPSMPPISKADHPETPASGDNDLFIPSRLNSSRDGDAIQHHVDSPSFSGIRPQTPLREPSLLPRNFEEDMEDLVTAKAIVSRVQALPLFSTN